MLTEAQLHQCHSVGLTTTEWLTAMTEVSRNQDDSESPLLPSEYVQVKVTMSCLTHTPPNALFSVTCSSTEPTNAS